MALIVTLPFPSYVSYKTLSHLHILYLLPNQEKEISISMLQNSSPTGNGLNPGTWAGVGLGAAGCIFVFCMWVFRWSKRDRDNIVRGEDAVAKMKRAFKIDGKGGPSKAQKGTMEPVGKPKLELKKAGDHWNWSALDEEMGTVGTVKVPSPVAKGA